MYTIYFIISITKVLNLSIIINDYTKKLFYNIINSLINDMDHDNYNYNLNIICASYC